MRTSRLLALPVLAVLAFAAPQALPASAQDAGALSREDRDFVTEAALTNVFERKAARLALDKGDTVLLVPYAQRMLEEHETLQLRLWEVAGPNSDPLPQEVTGERRQELDRLGGLSGADFTEAYIRGQIDAHEEAIRLYRAGTGQGRNAAVRSYAQNTLPTLEKHLQEARELEQAMTSATAKAGAGTSGGQ